MGLAYHISIYVVNTGVWAACRTPSVEHSRIPPPELTDGGIRELVGAVQHLGVSVNRDQTPWQKDLEP